MALLQGPEFCLTDFRRLFFSTFSTISNTFSWPLSPSKRRRKLRRVSNARRKHLFPTCSQRQWLHSSVGRASHRYREVTGSNPVEVLNFFQASLRNCLNCVSLRGSYLHFISFPQFIYDSFHISLTLISFTVTYEPIIDLLPTSVAS